MKLHDHEVVSYRPEYKNQIAELQTNLWGLDIQKNLAYFEWKYGSNPYLTEPLIYLTLSEGQVVGMVGYFGSKWEVESPSNAITALCTGDVVIDPDHRDRGYFSEMVKVSLDEIISGNFEFVFCMSANRISRFTLQMTGWSSAGALNWAYRHEIQESNLQEVKRFAKKIPYLSTIYSQVKQYRYGQTTNESSQGLKPFDTIDKNTFKATKLGSQVSVSKSPRIKDMVGLIEQNSWDGRYRHVRDHQYYTWRLRNPRSHYRFLYLDNTDLEGYLILQASIADSIGPVRILDWEYKDTKIFKDLINAAIQWGRFSNLVIWSATLTPVELDCIDSLGFKFINQDVDDQNDFYVPSLLLAPIQHINTRQDPMVESRPIIDISNWDLRQIFADDF